MRKLLFAAASGLTAILLGLQASAWASDTEGTDAGTARRTVDQFHESLLGVMKRADSTSTADRYKILEPEISQRFDLRLMIALATGKHWREATDDAKDRLAEAFRRFSVATYASRFSGYSGQSFETLEVSSGPRKTELVSTRINRPDDTPVALTYVTRVAPTGWRIVDVLVDDGISELAVRRSEYRSVLKTGGVEGLIKLLGNKTRALIEQ